MSVTQPPAQPPPSAPTPRMLAVLLAVAAVVGIVVSFASWCFLEVIHQAQDGVFTDLPRDLGYDNGAPEWWPLPVLALAGLVTAFAIVRLPGDGGHNPAEGLKTGVTQPFELPGVLLAAFATIALGAVLGPEAPLIALGTGLGILAIRLLRRDAGQEVVAVVAAAGSFAAISFIFGSPLAGAVILIEAAGLDRRKLMVVVPAGLLASGIGSLVSVGIGSWDGLSTSAFAIQRLSMPAFARPDVADFAWTIPLAAAIAVAVLAIFRVARTVQPALMARPYLLLPAAGLVVAALAIAFSQTTDRTSSDVLFSGQDQLTPLVNDAGTWSVSALALVLVFKGLAWSVSLAAFRGGPTFPALYLGAAAGILASHLPGLDLTPAIAVGMGAATVAVLRLPLAAVVLATLLCYSSGPGTEPVIIVGVVVAMLTTVLLSPDAQPAGATPPAPGAPAADDHGAPVAAPAPIRSS